MCAWRVSDFELTVGTTDAAMTSRATLTSTYQLLSGGDEEVHRG